MLPILLAHASDELVRELRARLSPRQVNHVRDPLAAVSQVSSAQFHAIVLEHPLGGMDAPDVVGWLRQSGAACLVVAVADGLDEAATVSLEISMGEDSRVVATTDASAIATLIGIAEGDAAPPPSPAVAEPVPDPEPRRSAPAAAPAAAPRGRADRATKELASLIDSIRISTPRRAAPTRPSPPPSASAEAPPETAPAPEVPVPDAAPYAAVLEIRVDAPEPAAEPEVVAPAVPSTEARGDGLRLLDPQAAMEFLARLVGIQLALEVDDAAIRRWTQLDLPPRLIGLLDGSRTAVQLLTESGLPERELATYLRVLEELRCLELIVDAVSDEDDGRDPAATAAPAWTGAEPSQAPDLQGSLAEDSAPELLLGLRRRKETGQLFVRSSAWNMRVDLSAGDPIRASGGPAHTLFGAVLVRLGFIDDAGQSRLLHEQQSLAGRNENVNLGTLALRLALLAPHHVLGALAAQIDARIEALAAVEEGTYRFYRGPCEPVEVELEPRHVEQLVASSLAAHGQRRLELVEAFLERARGKGLTMTPEAPGLLPVFGFGPRIQRLARSLDGRTLDEVMAATPLPEAETETTLYLLWAAGGIELGAPKLLPPRPPAPPPPSATAPFPAVRSSAVMPTAPSVEATGAFKVIDEKSGMEFVVKGKSRTGAPSSSPQPGRAASSPAQAAEETKVVADASEALKERNYRKALQMLQAARDRHPGSARVLAALGWTVFQSQPGSPRARAEACKLLQQALKIDDSEVSALVSLGRILRIEGSLTVARELLEHALALDRSHETAARELQQIDVLEGRTEGSTGGKRQGQLTRKRFP